MRDALRLLGHEERVIALSGALNVGPIHPPEPDVRRAWAEAHLRDDDACQEWHEPDAPWTQATSAGVHPVYWVCLSDAAEHASFLAFAARMSDPVVAGAVRSIIGRHFDFASVAEAFGARGGHFSGKAVLIPGGSVSSPMV